MTQPSLLDFAPVRVADTSLSAFELLRPHLQKRERTVLLAMFDYLEQTGHEDVTGGELTEYMRARGLVRDVNGCRPRLNGLQHKALIDSFTARKCRAYGTTAHPYKPAIPRVAVERKAVK